MKRRLLNLVTGLSLLLCLAAGGLWVRGIIVADQLVWRREWNAGERALTQEWRLLNVRGMVSLTRESVWQFPEGPGYVPGMVPTDIGPPVVGPPAMPRGPYRFEWRRLQPRAVLIVRTTAWEKTGFRFHRYAFESRTLGHGGRIRLVRVPCWAVMLLTAVPPLLRLKPWRLIRRNSWRLRGLCPACGYDLRATPQRCPECGASPAGALDPPAGA